VDLHHLDADPDSTYHPDADPDSYFYLMRIRMRIRLFTLIQLITHFDADPDTPFFWFLF
jgi:hypothetical protein